MVLPPAVHGLPCQFWTTFLLAMPIQYTVVPNTLTTPPSFAPRVVTRQTILLDTLVGETAAETAQSKEALLAAFTVVAEKIRGQLDAGNAVLWPDTLQIEPTLSGRMLTAASDLPPESVWGISIKAVGGFLTGFKTNATGERVAGDDKAPDIIEAAALNANLLALRPRDIVVLRGYRLAFDPSKPDEGVYLDPVAGGAGARGRGQYPQERGEGDGVPMVRGAAGQYPVSGAPRMPPARRRHPAQRPLGYAGEDGVRGCGRRARLTAVAHHAACGGREQCAAAGRSSVGRTSGCDGLCIPPLLRPAAGQRVPCVQPASSATLALMASKLGKSFGVGVCSAY